MLIIQTYQAVHYLVVLHEMSMEMVLELVVHILFHHLQNTSGPFPQTDSASLSVCTAQTGVIGSNTAVQGEMQCCTISNGNDNLICTYVIDRSFASQEVSVGCNTDQFIAGCAGWVDGNNANAIIKYEK